MIRSLLLSIAVVGVGSLSLAPLLDSLIEISVNCGKKIDNDPVLKILTDVDIWATAKCNGGDQEFTSTDSVHYVLPAAISTKGNRCLFYQRENSDHYYVEVLVFYGERDSLILTKQKIVTAICNYGDFGKDSSAEQTIVDGPMAPTGIHNIVGDTVPSSELTLSIQTVDDQDAVGPLALDRRYSLFGTYTGSLANVGLKPVSCDAVSKNGDRYSVLIAGCGDGMIFDRTEGFITLGKTFRSPYFVAFHLSTSVDLSFDCNVTLCIPNCDGSSCETDCGIVTAFPISNSELDTCTGTKFEDTCTFMCTTGHDKTGTGISTCGADGIWTVPKISCIPKDCGDPPSGPNVIVNVVSSEYQGTVTYSCEAGYIEADGSKSITCPASGRWTETASDILQCTTPISCGDPPSGPNLELDVSGVEVGEMVTYTCAIGYREDGGESSVTCLPSGKWSGSQSDILQCIPIGCGDPPSGPNLELEVSGVEVGEMVTYTCAIGYREDGGESSVTCLPSEKWSGSQSDILQCIPISCGDPPSGPNLELEVSGVEVGEVVTYTCAIGYREDGGESSVTCLPSGKWSGSQSDILQCIPIGCGDPPSGPNLELEVSGVEVGEMVTYTCAIGYREDGGESSVTCLRSGKWSGSQSDILQCIPIGCGDPPSGPNLELDVSGVEVGEMVTYTCAFGYREDRGESSVTCLPSGKWSGSQSDILQCILVDCGTPPDGVNVEVNAINTEFGGIIMYECLPGYEEIEGIREISCDPSGVWIETQADILSCSPIDCGDPPKPSSEMVGLLASDTTVGSNVKYECRLFHYEIEGSAEKTCLETGEWSNANDDLICSQYKFLGCISNTDGDFITNVIESPMKLSECNDHCQENQFTIFVWKNDKSCGCVGFTLNMQQVECEKTCETVHHCGTTEPNTGAVYVVDSPVLGHQEACLTVQKTFYPTPNGNGDASICKIICLLNGSQFMGLKFGLVCFCASEEVNMAATADPSECQPCEPDSVVKCGSQTTIYAYQFQP
ncbi:hypothetical protein LOTGIDRAFT_239312 [Lottia gigantea]|uniref:Sushi domain-containing protein n=1 Tax=Lottia gigantea TaxID=225164 RepID=V4AHJ9_LOTGI|nr:hypothetical protein LOTGIDRAFT_239312 [Lottia gigantea]ESO96387.1 hypothetical protein LOTGIDRAFT_239312 [Lottia gigantea]